MLFCLTDPTSGSAYRNARARSTILIFSSSPVSSPSKIYYRRRLPHYQPPGEMFFVTFRLAGSLPDQVIHDLIEWRDRVRAQVESARTKDEQERLQVQLDSKYFGHFNEVLDKARHASDMAPTLGNCGGRRRGHPLSRSSGL